MKTIILPRQARDKHKGKTRQKTTVFSQNFVNVLCNKATPQLVAVVKMAAARDIRPAVVAALTKLASVLEAWVNRAPVHKGLLHANGSNIMAPTLSIKDDGKKKGLVSSHFQIDFKQPIVLPRQARDKHHRESAQQQVFLQAPSTTTRSRAPPARTRSPTLTSSRAEWTTR